MTITAKVVADSISLDGIRLTTLEVIFPRFILSEWNTHRAFSRNASSSRAIPVKKILKMVEESPAMPIHWGMNQSGMQAYQELAIEDQVKAKDLWLEAAKAASNVAEKMLELNLHKQVVNRILEPFQHIHGLVSSTEWNNFFELRDHEAAQPEIRELAIQMKKALNESTPTKLEEGQWHLPFIREEEKMLDIEIQKKMSVARCARVSYMNQNGISPTTDEDIALYDRLAGSRPIHASPCEHQATPISANEWSGNFRGWKQYRKTIEESFNQVL